MSTMSVDELFELAKKELKLKMPNLPDDVFHLDWDRTSALSYLQTHPLTPIIIRKSSQQGMLALDLFIPELQDCNRFTVSEQNEALQATQTGKVLPLVDVIRNHWNAFLIRQELANLNLPLPTHPSIFQFAMQRDPAEKLLHDNPALPYIIRMSSKPGLLCLTSRSDQGLINHTLIEPTNEAHTDFKFCTVEADVKTLNPESFTTTLQQLVQKNTQRNLDWKAYKEQLSKTTPPAAILSIQSIDNKNVSLTAEEVVDSLVKDRNLAQIGNGHTGIAIASALKAPFVVLRSSEQHEQEFAVLRNELTNGSFVVLTAHGQVNGSAFTGDYLNETQGGIEEVERTPEDIVNSLMANGLNKGDQITLLLSVCYAAAGDNSLAKKLATELAKRGISSTLIASDTTVARFSRTSLDFEDKLTFDAAIGIAPQDVCVFTTKVCDATDNPKINLYRPNETIQLSKHGLRFLNSEELQKQKEQVKVLINEAGGKLGELVSTVEKKSLYLQKIKAQPQIQELLYKIDQMSQYGKKLSQQGNTKGLVMTKLAADLVTKLDDFFIKSFPTKPAPLDIEHFKSDFADLLHSQNTVLETHRQLWKPIVANILLAIIPLGLLAIIVNALVHVVDAYRHNEPVSLNSALFFANTKSQTLVVEADESLNQLQIEEINTPN